MPELYVIIGILSIPVVTYFGIICSRVWRKFRRRNDTKWRMQTWQELWWRAFKVDLIKQAFIDGYERSKAVPTEKTDGSDAQKLHQKDSLSND